VAASNYDDVLLQLKEAGLIVTELRVGTHRPVRCKVEGDREKRGWYRLHELTTDRGDLLIVGSFGVWHGNDNTARKVELRKTEISAEQREALKKRLAEDRRQAEQARRDEAAKAAQIASRAWSGCAPATEHEYLTKKAVGAFDVRVSPQGALVIPMCDPAGQIHGLQIIRTAAAAKSDRRPAKEFWPAGLAKKGHFHLIGVPDWLILVAEGYATAASLHQATHHPVAVAFDAGNIAPVTESLRKRYPRARILVCGDDDAFAKCIGCEARLVLADHPADCPSCGKPHGRINTGRSAASVVAFELETHGAWVLPEFADEAARRAKFIERGIKDTDFNDLQAAENSIRVRDQVEAKLRQCGWSRPSENAASTTSGAGGAKLRPIQSFSELRKRFKFVYAHSGAVFDAHEHILMSLSDMRDACVRKDIHRAWMEDPQREFVRIAEVGFDPGGNDTRITCNLFGGWPTTPVAGKCERLLELLRYLCSTDPNAEALYQWVLRWCAYPIQHPGAKMKSTLVLHGAQGAGKNMFFETLMSIYGVYGDVIDQSAIEDKFNDWASRKLFLIADEVVARSDLYHVKNKLKAFITGDRIRINPKNFAAYWEANHVNLVFLSNETMPVVLEEDDRRHCVIRTPPKRADAYYAAILQEIREGGIAALHDYLLNLDLGDFGTGTLPIFTQAKDELIKLALDSPIRFHDALITKDIEGLAPITARTEDWFEAYGIWCRRMNLRAAPQPKFVTALQHQRGVRSERCHWRAPAAPERTGPHGMLFLGDVEPPAGESKEVWLGRNVIAHRLQLDSFKERAK
jgi:putative DNA primase/helicase